MAAVLAERELGRAVACAGHGVVATTERRRVADLAASLYGAAPTRNAASVEEQQPWTVRVALGLSPIA